MINEEIAAKLGKNRRRLLLIIFEGNQKYANDNIEKSEKIRYWSSRLN